MAYENLDKFTESVVALIRQNQVIQDNLDADPKQRSVACHKEMLLWELLAQYIETVLSRPQWKSQRMYAMNQLEELCPAFFEGRFKRRKKV